MPGFSINALQYFMSSHQMPGKILLTATFALVILVLASFIVTRLLRKIVS